MGGGQIPVLIFSFLPELSIGNPETYREAWRGLGPLELFTNNLYKYAFSIFSRNMVHILNQIFAQVWT